MITGGQVDPFGTAGLRRAVLDAWLASPDRFREDANAEEDAALGAYRDRVVVELAQNAADAAARAGVPGRLLLRLEAGSDDGPARLVAANTGAPLDAAGVRALASLRASAKRDGAAGSVGRFGVGAASVLSVADEAVWWSAAGGVRFSAGSTRAALAALDGPAAEALAAEVAARGGGVPMLRLPFPVGPVDDVSGPGGPSGPGGWIRPAGADTSGGPDTSGEPGAGWDAVVVLLLRDGAAVAAVAESLAALDDSLLLALPALAQVRVELPGEEARVLDDAAARWHLLRRSGALPAELLAGLGVEERARAERTGWSLTWALGRDNAAREAGTLHAPTPTDDAVSLPALLVADLPLDAGRRRVPDVPAARAVLERAGAAYAELLEERAAAGEDVLPLVPVGLGRGWVDGVVRSAAVSALERARVLVPVDGGPPLPPDRAQALDDGPLADDPAALSALGPLVAGLVAAPRSARAALAVLGVRRVGLGEVAEALPADPAAWAAAAAALAGATADPAAREQLAALRVPLAGGRTAVGARGLLLPACGPALDGAVAVLAEATRRGGGGLRLVDPLVAADARARRLLTSLGAVEADARDLLGDPAVLAAVGALADEAADAADDVGPDGPGGWVDDGDVDPLAAAVLDLAAAAVAEGRLAPGELPGLADLPLPSASGEVLPAAALVVPGSPAAALLDPEEVAPAHPALLARWGPGALSAVGAAASLGVVRCSDVDPLDPPDALADLAGADAWFSRLAQLGGDGCTVAQVDAVRDLDLLRAGAEAELLGHLAADADLRAVVVEPVRVVRPDGSWERSPSLSASWLGEELGLRGCAAPWAPQGTAVALPPAPSWAHGVGEGLGSALGMVTDPSDLDADGWQRVLDTAPDRADGLAGPTGAVALLRLWAALGARADRWAALRPPRLVLALDPDDVVVVVPAERAVVVDDARWVQRTDLGARVVPPGALADAVADVLEIALSSERAEGTVGSVGELADVPADVRAVLSGPSGSCPQVWEEHDELLVDGAAVEWWVQGRGQGARVHAATTRGLACGLALAADRWDRRAVVEAVLVDPRRASRTLVEDAAGTGA